MTPATLDEESPSPVPAPLGTLGLLIVVVTASVTKGLSVVLELLFSPIIIPVIVVAVVIVIGEGVTTLVPVLIYRTCHIQCTSYGYFETTNIVEVIMTSPQSHATIHKERKM